MSDRLRNVLFLCTGNSCRSIIGEQLLNHLGYGRFRGYSAGSHPTGQVNPNAVRALDRRGVNTFGLSSKCWDVFERPDAPEMDIVITVCGNARGEVCPVWPGHPLTVHWGLTDPAEFRGGADETAKVFDATLNQLERLIEGLLALPDDRLTAEELNGLLETTPA
ncbi:MAG: arsenate reductase ArsC [Rhodospirillales bacterium]|nr:arsenate reductase ArsC [Alphaproteobacteria bacterium]MBL6948179.1 arsenate reductase ArsC [Rhodospirillales bacterium]